MSNARNIAVFRPIRYPTGTMPKVNKASRDVKLFLERGIENFYPSDTAVEKALSSGKRLKVYLGVDPTGPSLHMGHAIPLRKLGQLQAMGHEVIMLIGDFTAMIGDPTDKTATRKKLTRKEVLSNCKNYKKQASKFLKFSGPNAAKLVFNSKWLGKMNFSDVVDLAAHFTVQQMMERDMFKRRMQGEVVCTNLKCRKKFTPEFNVVGKTNYKQQTHPPVELHDATYTKPKQKCPHCGKDVWLTENKNYTHPKPIYLHEFLYPLMQGYDSVILDVDMEIGGNDQTFNMLAGRTLLREMKGREKFVITSTLLEDSTGKKMGKTEGNMITLEDAPEEMYGKVMSWTDGMIIPGFRLCTDVAVSAIDRMEDFIKKGGNPVEYKHQLAKEVVTLFQSSKEADKASAHFLKVHKSHEVPKDMPTQSVKKGMTLVDALVASKMVTSKSDARRQITQGGVKVDGKIVKDIDAKVKKGSTIQKGKRHFVKLV